MALVLTAPINHINPQLLQTPVGTGDTAILGPYKVRKGRKFGHTVRIFGVVGGAGAGASATGVTCYVCAPGPNRATVGALNNYGVIVYTNAAANFSEVVEVGGDCDVYLSCATAPYDLVGIAA